MSDQCAACAVGYYLPSGKCDHCDTSRPSALPPPEPQGHCERSRLATCSLPVSLVDDAAFALSYAASMANQYRQPAMADKLIALARDLIFRADAARAIERQPEENRH